MRGTAYVCTALLALLITPIFAQDAPDTREAHLRALVGQGRLPAIVLEALEEKGAEGMERLLPLLLAGSDNEGLDPVILMMLAKDGGCDIERLLPLLAMEQGKVGQLPLLWLACGSEGDRKELLPFLLLSGGELDPTALMLLAGENGMGAEEMALLQSLAKPGPHPPGPPPTAIVHGEHLLVIEDGTVYKIAIANMEVVDSVRYAEGPAVAANPLADLMKLGMLFRERGMAPVPRPDLGPAFEPAEAPVDGEPALTVDQVTRFLESIDDEAVEEGLDAIAEEHGVEDLDGVQNADPEIIRGLFDAAAQSEELSALVQAHGFRDAAEWVSVAIRTLPAMGPALSAMIETLVGDLPEGAAETKVMAPSEDELAVFTEIYGEPSDADVAVVTEAMTAVMGGQMQGAIEALSGVETTPEPPTPEEPEGTHVAW